MPLASEGDVVTVHFAAEIFNLDAIKRAAYRLSDRAAVEILPAHDGFDCHLRPLSKLADLKAIENQFRREVLDYDLREKIAKETEPLRNLILSIAFSKTGLPG